MTEQTKQTSTAKVLGMLRNGQNAKDGQDAPPAEAGRLMRIVEERPDALDGGARSGKAGLYCEIFQPEAALARVKSQFDGIWSNILLKGGKTPQSILLTAGAIGDGVSYVAERLALYLAQIYSYKTLYVNVADELTSEKSLAPVLGPSDALLDLLSSEEGLARLTAASNIPNIYAISLCRIKGKEAQPWLSPKIDIMETLLAYAKNNFDVVVLDAQPVMMAPWTVSMARKVDCNLLVSRFAVTRREVMGTVLDSFLAGNVEIDGVILNDRRFCVPKKLYSLLK